MLSFATPKKERIRVIDRSLQLAAQALGYAIVALMVLLVVGSLIGRRPGSLDDLTAAEIKHAVNGETR
jgi:hypothetical protein